MPQDALANLVNDIDAVLPQTQCRRCGYADCRDYALAIAEDRADFNQCPPGGAAGIVMLAALLDRAPKPLSAAHGVEAPPLLAVIDEAICIGCTLCLQACPIDAIVGAAKRMHTVLIAQCTGCELCVAPCPVDCIAMIAAPPNLARITPDAARARYQFRQFRLARDKEEKFARLEAKAAAKIAQTHAQHLTPQEAARESAKHTLVAAAIARARERQMKP